MCVMALLVKQMDLMSAIDLTQLVTVLTHFVAQSNIPSTVSAILSTPRLEGVRLPDCGRTAAAPETATSDASEC